MILRGEKAREQVRSASAALCEKFASKGIKGSVSAQYINLAGNAVVAGVSGLDFESPFVSVLLQKPELDKVLRDCFTNGKSILFEYDGDVKAYSEKDGTVEEVAIDASVKSVIKDSIEASFKWGGELKPCRLMFTP